MSSRSRRKRSLFILGSGLLAATFALGSGAVGFGSAAYAAPPAETDGLDYVALGDSYAAGLGISPSTGDVAGCGQSSSNYPHLVAAELGLDLTDVTCSGADTTNIIDTPQVTTSGTNPVQSNALSADTDIVTVTIGGNDLGFAQIIQTCIALSASGPLLFDGTAPNCESLFAPGGADTLSSKIANLVSPGLANTFEKIRTEAPNAKVFVVGYPALMPDAANTPGGGCYTDFTSLNPFPFTDTDVEYLHGVQANLDAAISSAAATAGATFVPLFGDSLGNTPCADNPGTFINGVAGPGAMHSNATGAEFMADGLQASIMSTLAAPVITSAAPTPSTLLGTPYSFNVTASGFPLPSFSLSAGQLPDHMTLDATTGKISGTPNLTGTSTFSITASNSVGSVTEDYSISVNQAPTITSATPPSSGTVGNHFSFIVSSSGFPAPQFAIASGALPDGLQFTPATGEIFGTPTTAGRYTFSISATNSVGVTTSPLYRITVSETAADTTVSTTHSTVPTLVNTGADPLLPVGLAGALTLLAGAVVLLTRRRA